MSDLTKATNTPNSAWRWHIRHRVVSYGTAVTAWFCIDCEEPFYAG
jgi:hypothetical protein